MLVKEGGIQLVEDRRRGFDGEEPPGPLAAQGKIIEVHRIAYEIVGRRVLGLDRHGLDPLPGLEGPAVGLEFAKRQVKFEPAVDLRRIDDLEESPPVEKADRKLELRRPAVGGQIDKAFPPGIFGGPHFDLPGEPDICPHHIVRLHHSGERVPASGMSGLLEAEETGVPADILGIGITFPAIKFGRLEIKTHCAGRLFRFRLRHARQGR